MTKCAVLAALAIALLLASAQASSASWRSCGALTYSAGVLRTLPSIEVLRDGAPGAEAGLFIGARGVGCAAAQTAVAAALAGDDEPTALGVQGFRPIATHKERRIAGRAAYSVVAAHGTARIRYWRLGRRLTLDHSVYRAGQWVDIYGDKQFGKCTGAWVLQPPGAAPVGLTAGHCIQSTFTEDLPVLRGFAGHDASRLGTILEPLQEPDATTFSIATEWGVAQQVERGAAPPLTVTGWVRTRDQDVGDRVCFAGRTSGADRCGRIVHRYRFVQKYLRCTDIRADHGDSGGPVYTPGFRLSTRAVGIVVKVGVRFSGGRGKMCYAPIEGILDATGDRLPAGPLVRGPGVPE
jgi:hypothetical protein